MLCAGRWAGHEHPAAGCLPRLMLGLAREALGDHERALKSFQAAVEHRSNTVAAEHPALIRARALSAQNH
jgi:hypothetical protein